MFRNARHRRAAFACLPLCVVLLTGCPDPQYNNQGGGSIITVGTKLSEGNIGDLNPDEWQIAFADLPTLAQFAGFDLGGIVLPELTDEQAQAIVDFLEQYDIRTFDDLSTLDPNTVEIPEVLLPLVEPYL